MEINPEIFTKLCFSRCHEEIRHLDLRNCRWRNQRKFQIKFVVGCFPFYLPDFCSGT